MKCEAISTAFGKYPPPFPLKSSITHAIFSPERASISFFKNASVCSPINAISIYAIFLPLSDCITSTFTDGIVTFCLVTSTVNTLFAGSVSVAR